MPSRANASSRMSVGRRRRTDNQEEESNKGGDAAVVLGGGSCNDEGGQEGSEGVHTFSTAPKSLVPKNPRKRRRTRGLDPNEVASEQCDGVFEGSAASQGNLLGRTSLPSSDKLEEGVKANPTDGIQNGDSTAEVRDVASLPRHKSDSRNLQDATASDPTSPPAATRRTSLRNRRCSALLTRAGLSNDADADDDDDDDDGVHAEHDEKDDVDDGRGEGKEERLETDAKSSRRRAPNPKRDKQAICPHCHKEFSSAEGLNYHLARWVCRKADCPDPAIVEQGNRKRGRGKAYSTSGGSAKKKWEKFRGPEEERICPRCKRVFTSILGLQYHLKKNVCLQGVNRIGSSGRSSADATPAMPLLQAGERFVTAFGVVEVIKDGRATPTALLPVNLKKTMEKFVTEKGRLMERMTRAYVARSSRLRARRMKINALYEDGKVNRHSIAEAYSGFEDDQPPVTVLRPIDPSGPPDSFPERIVECVLVPDTRPRIVGVDRKREKTGDGPGQSMNSFQAKLYLQRRLLVEPYHEEGSVYLCQFCNMKFGSLPGQKYHIENTVCLKRGLSNTDKRVALEQKIFASASALLETHVALPNSKPIKTKKPRRKQDQGIYPEVLISLGFELLSEKIENITLVPNSDDEEEGLDGLAGVVDPGEVLHNLQEELKRIELLADVQKHGSMYSEVFRSLGFRKPGKRKVSDRVNDVGTKKRRRRAAKPIPIIPPKPLPPIIDVQALVDEVDTGRYPSMSRFKGDAHQDNCSICKDGGDLYCCDFCNQVEHLRCLRERFTVKQPEPDEDFMCHKCIQTVLWKRRRAEKRRTLKQKGDEEERRQKEVLQDGLAKGGNDREYQFMAAKGQEVSELVELLQDAQLRLRQACETSKLNNIRRQIIEGGY